MFDTDRTPIVVFEHPLIQRFPELFTPLGNRPRQYAAADIFRNTLGHMLATQPPMEKMRLANNKDGSQDADRTNISIADY
jgi:hypothetical protein